MKTLQAFVAFFAVAGSLAAQTNTFPTTGSAGIGTLSPGAGLHISTSGSPIPLKLERTGGQANALSVFFTSNPVAGCTLGVGSTIFQNSNSTGDIAFFPGTGASNPARSMILTTEGKLSLGIASNVLQSRLNVKVTNATGSAAVGGIFSEVNSDADWQYNLVLQGNRNKGKSLTVYNSLIADETFLVYGDGTTQIGAQYATGAYANAKLSVDGMMVAKEIYVQTSNWADYVFDKGYSLRSLEEVDSYIQENGHLPNMPSAQEVKDNGYDLANADRLLLEKVEELTLYMIEMNKELEMVKAENAAMKSKPVSSDK